MRAIALLLILLAVSGCKNKEDFLVDSQAAAAEDVAAQAAAQGVRQDYVRVQDLGNYRGTVVLLITNSATGAECYSAGRAIHCNFPTTP